jgi:hypothetical protein
LSQQAKSSLARTISWLASTLRRPWFFLDL